MKAAYLVAPQTFEIRSVPDPSLPPGGIILRVIACGVCGSDLRRWKEGPPAGSGGIIPGHEITGQVVAVDPALDRYAVGDRLAVAPDIHCGQCYYCQRARYNLCDHLRFLGIHPDLPGGFSELMPLSADILTNGVIHPIPADLPDDPATLAEPCSSVLATHDRLCTSPSDVVVVMGAGPIGCLHVAVAKARGAITILTEPVAVRRAMAQPLQPEAILDPTQEDVVARVRSLTGGLGADIAICANPIAATQTQAVELVRKGGKVILFGGLPKANPLTTLDSNRIHYGEIEVSGAFSYHPTFHELALRMLQRGLIPTQHLITHSFPLAEVAQAFAIAASGEALKVLVKV